MVRGTPQSHYYAQLLHHKGKDNTPLKKIVRLGAKQSHQTSLEQAGPKKGEN